MKIKILVCVFLCLVLFGAGGVQFSRAKAVASIQEDPEMTELKEKQKYTMMDIGTIASALVDYVSDHGVLPQQDGTYDEDSEFYRALCPFYVKVLPVTDSWGHKYRVYCGETINGKYGISGCAGDDFMAVSFGQDGKEEDWEFDASNPGAGLYEIESAEDFDKDLIMWNGSWIRAPWGRRR
ncbi:MAG: hypothetical protein PVF66_08645 [Candidatus Aminicenantes bacterium]|jgi:hypothetical protein